MPELREWLTAGMIFAAGMLAGMLFAIWTRREHPPSAETEEQLNEPVDFPLDGTPHP